MSIQHLKKTQFMIKIEKKLWDPQNASLVTENPIY